MEKTTQDNSQIDLFDSCEHDAYKEKISIRKQSTFEHVESESCDMNDLSNVRSNKSKQTRTNPSGANPASRISYLDSDTDSDSKFFSAQKVDKNQRHLDSDSNSDCEFFTKKKACKKLVHRHLDSDNNSDVEMFSDEKAYKESRTCQAKVFVPNSLSHQPKLTKKFDTCKQHTMIIADSYVPETVTTVPESVLSQPLKSNKSSAKEHNFEKEKIVEKKGDRSHLSVLDDLF